VPFNTDAAGSAARAAPDTPLSNRMDKHAARIEGMENSP
jgi:hypothetical protein